MDFEKKYLKYKNKYVNQKGGVANPANTKELLVEYVKGLINQTSHFIKEVQGYTTLYKGYAIIFKLNIHLVISETPTHGKYSFTLKLELIKQNYEIENKNYEYKLTIIHEKKREPTSTTTHSLTDTEFYELELSYPTTADLLMNAFTNIGTTTIGKNITDPSQIPTGLSELHIEFINLINEFLSVDNNTDLDKSLEKVSNYFSVKLQTLLYNNVDYTTTKCYKWTIIYYNPEIFKSLPVDKDPDLALLYHKEYIIFSPVKYICAADISETFFKLRDLKATGF